MTTQDRQVRPPARLRSLISWQANKVATLGARLTAQRMALPARSDFAVLAVLDESGPASQAELGRQLGLDRNDVSGVVARLHAGGYVDREVDPANRRRNTVRLTAAGLEHLQRLQQHADEVQEELLMSLTPGQRRQLQELLAALLDAHPSAPA